MLSFIHIRRNTKIKSRFRALLIFIVILIIILSYFGIRGISKVNETGIEINKNYLNNITELYVITENLYSIVIEGKNHILAIEPASKAQSEKLINEYINKVDTLLERYGHLINDDRNLDLFNELLKEYEMYKRINQEILVLSLQKKDYLALELSATSELETFRGLQTIIKRIMTNNLDNANKSIVYANQLKENTINRNYFIIGIIIAIAFVVAYILINDLSYSITQLKNALMVLGRGEVPDKKIDEYKDEIGQMAIIANRLSNNLSYLGNFATEIGEGNYHTSFTPLSQRDILGNKLINLRDNLQKAKEEETKRRVEDDQRNWASKGLAKFAEILRQNSDNIHHLAESIISNCVKYIGANQGGIFSYNDDSQGDIYLELLAAYAYDRKKFINKRINLGDGLIGTCALEKQTMYMTDIPEKYLEITSGLGKSAPKAILIVPLKIEETILGVIELASFNELEKYQIGFVERLAESIAVSLSTARINARTIKLFEESQRQSTELARQEDEMRQNLQEMRLTQEDAIRKEIEMKGIMSAVDNTLIKCEYNPDGTLISANSQYLSLMEYRLDEIKGKNVKMFVPDEKLEKFQQYWQNLLNGIPHQGTINRTTRKGEIRWLLMSYTPVKDHDGKVFKILLLANDISEYIFLQKEAKQKAEELVKQQEELKLVYEESYQRQNDHIENYRKIKILYENEMTLMYRNWMNNLTKAESLKDLYLKQLIILDNKEKDLNESKKKIQSIREELDTIKSKSETKETPNIIEETEIDKLYGEWLKDFGRDK